MTLFSSITGFVKQNITMQQLGLLKKMLPGLLPIFIFILADEIWGTEIGLIVAVVIGILQLIYFAVKEKRLEKFVLFDTLLIIGMGAVSIILENDIFFKLKPAVIEFIMIAFLAFSLFSKHNIMLKMSERYMKGIEINDAQAEQMNKSLRNLLIILVLHFALAIYSTFWMSTAAWAFISTALFYIIIGVYFGAEFLMKYLKNKGIEYLPVVDEEGNVIGKASRIQCHNDPSLIYPVVRLHVFNKEGKILLQRRSLKSDIEPGKWDAAVAGHVQFGEKIEDAVKRETKEEINLDIQDFQLIEKRLFHAEKSTALMFVFITVTDVIPVANKDEVEEIAFFNINEIQPIVNLGKTTKGLAQELKMLKQIRIEGRR